MDTLVTHDGQFHADEVFASAVLSKLFPYANKLRTRNLNDLPKNSIIYDVGMEYDGKSKFDHHQEDDSLIRDNGIPYSSFGLIWKHFGVDFLTKKFIIDSEAVNEIHSMVDSTIVQAIDAADNGMFVKDIPTYGISTIINRMNHLDVYSKDQKLNFNFAIYLAYRILTEEIKTQMKIHADTTKVKSLITDSELLVLPEYLEYRNITQYTHIRYVIFPTGDEWRVTAVDSSCNFDPDNLVTDDNFVFCHKSGFIAGTKTLESAKLFYENNKTS